MLVADHVVDRAGGYTCTVSSAPPEHLRMLPSARPDSPAREAFALTVGEVLRVDDPEGRGRVRVG